MESCLRSWTKSLSWRIIGVFMQGVITYLFTRSWSETLGITSIFQSLRFVLYYFHERAWQRIQWGRKVHPLAHLAMRPDLDGKDVEDIRRLLAAKEYLHEGPEYEI